MAAASCARSPPAKWTGGGTIKKTEVWTKAKARARLDFHLDTKPRDSPPTFARCVLS